MVVTLCFPHVKSPVRKELDTDIDADKAGPAGALWADLKSRAGLTFGGLAPPRALPAPEQNGLVNTVMLFPPFLPRAAT